MLCVPLLVHRHIGKGISQTASSPAERKRAMFQYFAGACLTPCIVLLEVLVLSGNITPWVFAEPLLLAGVGNVSIHPAIASAVTPVVLPTTHIRKVDQNIVELTDDKATNVLVRTNNVTHVDCALIAVGGIGGGFDSPANGLYERLGAALKPNVLVLDVRLRTPGEMDRSIEDLRMAISYARLLGCHQIILMGHSFGGGVVVSTALQEPGVSSVIALSTQTTGCENVDKLPPCSLLLIHGIFDYVNPRFCSEDVFRRAKSEKVLRLVPATHLLNEDANDVFELAKNWIVNHRRAQAG
jgi:hypothetical protein